MTAALALLVLCQAMASPDEFLARARDASVRFRDRAVAIAEGYRPIGPDAPAMGQHWINVGLATEGAFDPARPPILTYASLAGVPTLVGIAFVAPVPPRRSPPEWPAGPGKWHVHARAVDVEGHVLSHAHGPAAHDAGWRVAVLHAWVWVDNPDGPFAAENWTLPWLRAGLVPPAGAPCDAARAVALAAGGDAFYAAQLRVVAGLDGADADAAARVTADHGRRVVEWAGQRQGRPPGAADIEWLEETWLGWWRELAAVVSASARARVAQARSTLDP